ncbi:MAG: PhoH family protein [Nevskiales bacterium]|nr:PhoH family protein [Nevskiales bacterium]
MSARAHATARRRLDLVLEPDDLRRLANLNGPFDAHLRQIERRLGVEIRNRGNRFHVLGPKTGVAHAKQILRSLFEQAEEGSLTPEQVHLRLAEAPRPAAGRLSSAERDGESVAHVKQGMVRGRSAHQREYLRDMATCDLTFGIGPAGTGKTYLAVASAVQALDGDRVRRIVLVRPAVEAGEKLGFLPGDMAQKVDPYLRPLYDALYEMLGFERVTRLVERGLIEVAPLAFMRGRTLNESFIILDEAQNTTIEQMKMFLTRIGFGSRAVVTGDITQIDLPRQDRSGLRHAIQVLKDVAGIRFTMFGKQDVVRHPLVQAIVHAYEIHESRESGVGSRESGKE